METETPKTPVPMNQIGRRYPHASCYGAIIKRLYSITKESAAKTSAHAL
jgi:hypothetical protein